MTSQNYLLPCGKRAAGPGTCTGAISHNLPVHTKTEKVEYSLWSAPVMPTTAQPEMLRRRGKMEYSFTGPKTKPSDAVGQRHQQKRFSS